MSRALAAVAALALAAGCGREKAKQGEEERPAGVPDIGAADFYRDYSSLKGAARFKKYSGGVRVSGTVKEVVDLGRDEGLQLWLAAPAPGSIAVKFQDRGAAATKQKIQPGQPVALLCQMGGKPDAVLFLVDCILE
jgi:hypothetical protein